MKKQSLVQQNTAPLRFNNNSKELLNPEVGAIEYDGKNTYYVNKKGERVKWRKKLQEH